jgi:hypothetical protein
MPDAVARAVPDQVRKLGRQGRIDRPVSSTKRPTVAFTGPVTNASTTSSSPSITKGVSYFVIEDEDRTGLSNGDAAGVVVTDQIVVVPPRARLLDRRAPRLAVADDARGTKFEAGRMDAIHLDQTHPFVGVSRADLGPRQWLGERGRYDLGSFGIAHGAMFVHGRRVSSFDGRKRAGSHRALSVDLAGAPARCSAAMVRIRSNLRSHGAIALGAMVAPD